MLVNLVLLLLGVVIGIVASNKIVKKWAYIKQEKALVMRGGNPTIGYLSLEVGIDWFYPTLLVSKECAQHVKIGEIVLLSDFVECGDNVIVGYGNAINVSTKKKDNVRVEILDRALVNGLLMLSGKLIDK